MKEFWGQHFNIFQRWPFKIGMNIWWKLVSFVKILHIYSWQPMVVWKINAIGDECFGYLDDIHFRWIFGMNIWWKLMSFVKILDIYLWQPIVMWKINAVHIHVLLHIVILLYLYNHFHSNPNYQIGNCFPQMSYFSPPIGTDQIPGTNFSMNVACVHSMCTNVLSSSFANAFKFIWSCSILSVE